MTKERVNNIIEYSQKNWNADKCVHITTLGGETFLLKLHGARWTCTDDVLHHSEDDGETWIEYKSIVAISISI